MANAPLTYCRNCREFVRGRCQTCAKKPRSRSKQSQASQSLYDWKWRQASLRFREEHPLCSACEVEGKVTPSTCVDHVIPHRGDLELFWRESNWAALCDAHHRSKTAKGL